MATKSGLLEALRQAEEAASPQKLSDFLKENLGELHKLWGPDTKLRKAGERERWKQRARTLAEQFPDVTPDGLRMAWYRARLKQGPVMSKAEEPTTVRRGGFATMGPGNT